jgi:hypothetical protein
MAFTGPPGRIVRILASINRVRLGLIDLFWTSRKNSLELIELSSINKGSLV